MAIVQDAFLIPDDIATGLATGWYRRIGSVVRYADGPNKGQIVKHLQPIDLNTPEQTQSIGTKAFQYVKGHKKGTIITFSIVTIAGASIYAYYKFKSHEPRVIVEFRASLRVYIDAIRNGNMDIKKINSLMNSLEQLKANKDYKKFSIQFTTEEIDILVQRIYDYTIQLANNNMIDLLEGEIINSMTGADAIINLQSYLKVQKRIFAEVS